MALATARDILSHSYNPAPRDQAQTILHLHPPKWLKFPGSLAFSHQQE